jgi:hypothetical protein
MKITELEESLSNSNRTYKGLVAGSQLDVKLSIPKGCEQTISLLNILLRFQKVDVNRGALTKIDEVIALLERFVMLISNYPDQGDVRIKNLLSRAVSYLHEIKSKRSQLKI